MNSFDELGKRIGEIDLLIEGWITKLGLGYNHFAVLYTLANSPDGQCTQKYIGEEWLLPKQTVFNICKEYKAKGWITFHESAADKRERIMRLTDAGKAQAIPVLHATRTMCDKTFTAFGKQKTARLFALMMEFCQVCGKEIERFETAEKSG